MGRMRRYVPALVAAAVMLIASACGSDGPGATATDVDVGFQQFSVTAGEGAVWVVPDPGGDGPTDQVLRLDPETGEPLGDPVTVPGTPWVVAADDGQVWVAHSDFDGGENGLTRIDPSTGAATDDTIPLDFTPSRLDYRDGTAWIVEEEADDIIRVDTATGETTTIAFSEREFLSHVAVGSGGVWVAGVEGTLNQQPFLDRIDPETNRRSPEPIVPEGDGSMNDLAAPGEALWVSRGTADEVLLVEIDSSSQQSIGVGAQPGPIAAGDADVWVGNEDDDTVSRIDVGTGDVVDTIDVAGRPSALSVGDGAVWVAIESGTNLSRIELAEG